MTATSTRSQLGSTRMAACLLAVVIAIACTNPTALLANGFSPSSVTVPMRRACIRRASDTQQQGQTTPEAQQQRLKKGLVAAKKARDARPRGSTSTSTSATSSQAPPQQRSGRGGDVGDLFRMEVAQRLKEIKLMTQPNTVPAATAEAALMGPETLGDASALERQIALLSTRIKSIADHLQVTPTDGVSRKGLVALVKRRRFLLETLRHRDNDRWLATTESLGLRQRPDGPVANGQQDNNRSAAARRSRRRERGKARRANNDE